MSAVVRERSPEAILKVDREIYKEIYIFLSYRNTLIQRSGEFMYCIREEQENIILWYYI